MPSAMLYSRRMTRQKASSFGSIVFRLASVGAGGALPRPPRPWPETTTEPNAAADHTPAAAAADPPRNPRRDTARAFALHSVIGTSSGAFGVSVASTRRAGILQ